MNKFTLHLIKGLTGIDIEELENNIDALQTKNQQLSFLIKDANKETSYRRTQLIESQKQLVKSEGKINEQQLTLFAQNKEIGVLQKDLAGILKYITELQQEKQTILLLRQSDQNEINEQKDTITRLSEQIRSLRQQEQNAQEKAYSLTIQIEELKAQYICLQTEKETQDRQITDLTHTASIHSQLKNALQDTEKEIEEYKKATESLKQENDILQKEIKELQASITQEAINHKQVEQEWMRKYTVLQQELSQVENTRQQIQENFQQWKEKYTVLQQDFSKAEAEKSTLNQTISDLHNTLLQIQAEKETMESSFEEIQKVQETERKEEAAQNEQIIQVQKQTNENLRKEIKQLQDALSQAENACQHSQAEAQKQQEAHTALQQKFSQAETEIAKLNQTVAQLQHTLQQSQAEKEEVKQALLEIQHTQKEEQIHIEECTDTSNNSSEEQPDNIPEPPQPESSVFTSTPSLLEQCKDESNDLLQAYQAMKAELEKSTLHYPYTRITLASNGSQSIYESRTLQLKTELFTWGIEGKEVILDEAHFIAHDEIGKIEGIETPFLHDTISCDFSDEGNAGEIAETLLMAICCYHPLRITYRDKNGRSSERNLYWICFQPQSKNKVNLPYEDLFNDMLEGEIDSDHILAMHAHHQEARIFTINQIQSIQVFDAFVTTDRGIRTQIDGLYTSVLASQPEAAEMIYQWLPEQFKQQPQVISRRAHYLILTGNYEKAMELYLSISPETSIEKHFTWQQANGEAFDAFIQRGVESERFEQLKEALREEGWEL